MVAEVAAGRKPRGRLRISLPPSPLPVQKCASPLHVPVCNPISTPPPRSLPLPLKAKRFLFLQRGKKERKKDLPLNTSKHGSQG
jgi:hypothetical protein